MAPNLRPTRLLVALAAAAVLGGCGGGSTTTAAPEPAPGPASTLPTLDAAPAVPAAPSAPSSPPAGSSVLPDLVVDDVGAGTKVDLASLVPSPQPVLLWFWAPH